MEASESNRSQRLSAKQLICCLLRVYFVKSYLERIQNKNKITSY